MMMEDREPSHALGLGMKVAITCDHMSLAGPPCTLLFSLGLLQGPCAYIVNIYKTEAQKLNCIKKKIGINTPYFDNLYFN